MSTIGIIQPNYIPWRGYFDFIRQVDTFVFLDDVQFTRRDWRTRNRIKLPGGGSQWLTVPVSGSRDQRICDVRIDNTQDWQRKHLQSLRHCYSRAPAFDEYFPELEEMYEPGRFERLAELNVALTRKLCTWLDLTREFVSASDLGLTGVKDHRLIAIVERLQGDAYLSGPAAKDYIQPELWDNAGIELRYMSYDGYPEYPQVSSPFEPAVSVLDLLFMVGRSAPEFIWGEKRAAAE